MTRNILQRRHIRSRARDERGQVLLWTVILLPLLLALVGLVFDGGLLYVQYRRGRWSADGAAVAAASEINTTVYLNTNRVQLDTAKAASTARRYAADNDPDLQIGQVTVSANTIYVRGTLTVRPIFLGMFGVGPFQLQVTGQERPAWGITRKGQ